MLALAAGAAAQSPAPVEALPIYDGGGTREILILDTGSGAAVRSDQIRRDPLRMRVRRLAQNLYRDIGRPTDQPAIPGEVLLAPIRDAGGSTEAALFVETSTGYVVYFDQLSRGTGFGRITTTIGRPFGPLASGDGNYALLVRRDSVGRTTGAYLYHATTGRALYLSGLAKLDPDAPVAEVEGLPALRGRVIATGLIRQEVTVGYLVADQADGSLRVFDLADSSGRRFTVRPLEVALTGPFPEPGAQPTHRRYLAVPIDNSAETTEHVLFVDVSSGEMALLIGVDDRSRAPSWRKLPGTYYRALRSGESTDPRSFAAVPELASNGATVGVWLIDSLTGERLHVADPRDPGAVARRVVPN